MIEGAESGRGAIFHARLMVITDTKIASGAVLEKRMESILRAARPRTVVVQLRDVDLPVRERLSLGFRIIALCKQTEQWLIVNDRCDVARILGAHGVHLGERSVQADDARAVLGEEAWISCAAHDPRRVCISGADAVVLSPIFEPRKGNPPLGSEALQTARAVLDAVSSNVRLFALGGVDASSAPVALCSGADGVAVIGAALDGRDPTSILQALDIAR